jgi:hypothetical protein
LYLSNSANYAMIYRSLGTAPSRCSSTSTSRRLLLGEEVSAAIYGGATGSEMQS